jgi:hypothetical protein
LVILNLAEAHLVVGFCAGLPLVALCLDALISGPCRRPIITGVALGIVATWQFSISSEVLLITAAACAVVMATVLVARTGSGRCEADDRVAWKGLGAGGIVAVLLLAGPVWFALAGPSHVTGAIYPGSGVAVSGASLSKALWPTPPSPAFDAYVARIGGYQGTHLAGEYFGIGVVVVVVLGLIVWRRDRRLQLCAGLGALFFLFGLGSSPSGWRPWDLVAHLPLAQNIIPVRLLLVTWLSWAAATALVADRLHRELPIRLPVDVRWRSSVQWIGGLAVLATAVVPPAAYLTQTLPLTVEPVRAPTWFTSVAPRLSGHQVVLALPVPFSAIQSSLSWQVAAGLSFAMAGGDGPGSDLAHAGVHREAEQALASVSGAFPQSPIGPGAPTAVRRALADWGVTRVVLPHERWLPAYDRAVDPVRARALVTAAVGHPPRSESGSWVWVVGAGG